MALIELKNTPLSKAKEQFCVPFNKPTLIRGGCLGMPALKSWTSKKYLKEKFGDCPVDLEIYKKKEDLQTSKSTINENKTFHYYIDNMHWSRYLPDCSLNTLKFKQNIHHDLFRDLDNPIDLEIGLPNIPNEYFMFLGMDNKTGNHVHVEDDFYVNMIFGTKTFYFTPFKELHMRGLFNKYNNFSKENHWDLEPKDYNMYYAKLEPGDTLCLPPWWWHAVDNHGYTCAITKIYDRTDLEYFDWPGYEDLRNRHRLHTVLPEWIQNVWRKIF